MATKAPRELSPMLYEAGKKLLDKEFPNVEVEQNMRDLFGYSINGDCIEIEVKASLEDFYKEFNKPCKRDKHKSIEWSRRNGVGYCPTRFYFIVPYHLKFTCLRKMNRHRPQYGMIVFNQVTGECQIYKKAKRLTDRPYMGEKIPKKYSKFKEAYIG